MCVIMTEGGEEIRVRRENIVGLTALLADNTLNNMALASWLG